MRRKQKEKIAKIITTSTLWNLGKDAHNALSELVETLSLFVEAEKAKARLKEVESLQRKLAFVRKEKSDGE